MLKRVVSAAAAVLVGAVVAPAPASAQEELRFAHVYEVTEPYHTWALWAAEQIAERTDGRYVIEVFPAAQLGNEEELTEGLSLGTVDIIYNGPAFLARTYPPISISLAPFVWRDYDHFAAYPGSDLYDDLTEEYHRLSGNQVVAITYYGRRHVTSDRPIDTPEDMAGLKIRVPNAPLYRMFPEAVGANPTPIAFAEVYLALQQGVVEAQENPLPTIQAKRFYEVQEYINLTGHMTDAFMTVIGGHLWDSLSEEDRLVFAEILSEAAANAGQDIVQKEQELAAWFEAQGVTVNEIDRQPFMDAVQPALRNPDNPWTEDQLDRLLALGQ